MLLNSWTASGQDGTAMHHRWVSFYEYRWVNFSERSRAVGTLVCRLPTAPNIELAKTDLLPAVTADSKGFFAVGTITIDHKETKQFWIRYYDCLSGQWGLDLQEKNLADLWSWMDKQDRKLNADQWPNYNRK